MDDVSLAADLQSIRGRSIYFGHQSVGVNLRWLKGPFAPGWRSVAVRPMPGLNAAATMGIQA